MKIKEINKGMTMLIIRNNQIENNQKNQKEKKQKKIKIKRKENNVTNILFVISIM
jgi:hypothetical protein